MAEIAIAGAGFSGAVIARELADAGHHVTVFEGRDHVAGNCHSERDKETGVLVHVYGPHIFHTQHEDVWSYINRYGTIKPYVHRVKATAFGRVYSLPVGLHTINQFFDLAMRPSEAQAFIAAKAEERDEVVSFEDQALAFVGREIYETFLAVTHESNGGSTRVSCRPASFGGCRWGSTTAIATSTILINVFPPTATHRSWSPSSTTLRSTSACRRCCDAPTSSTTSSGVDQSTPISSSRMAASGIANSTSAARSTTETSRVDRS
jgi:NAD(P)-binding Rossmann-like domain